MADLVLGHAQPHCRQLVHLTPLDPLRRVVWQHLLAAAAAGGAMSDDRIRRLHQSHPMAAMAAMARLSAGVLPAGRAQALRLARQPVAGGWFGAIVAVLGEPPPQFLHLGEQRPHLLAQGGILNSQGSALFFWRHATSLPDKATPC